MAIALMYEKFLMVAAAWTFGTAILLSNRFAIPRWRAIAILTCSALMGIFGARILYWLTHQRQVDNIALMSFSASGFSLYGGLALGVATGGILSRWLQISALRMADLVTVPIAMGIAIVRLGCWNRGCCYGIETNLPWGITPTANSPAWIRQLGNNPLALIDSAHAVHPTQLYELFAALLAGLLAVMLLAKRVRHGLAACAAGILFTCLRLLIAPLRDYSGPGIHEQRTMLALYGPIIALLIAVSIWIWRKKTVRSNQIATDALAKDSRF
ncbi:MAG: prolipoprotein diacylglyceryl transferase [Pirellulaceae bacterium]